MLSSSMHVVDYLTKVQISQQITTDCYTAWALSRLSITLQRYKFLSKSQHRVQRDRRVVCCRLPYKGTNFSANHNTFGTPSVLGPVVDYLTKVQISQQITTLAARSAISLMLSITLQRYKFLSKSQLQFTIDRGKRSCRLPYKGTNFSANHNTINH